MLDNTISILMAPNFRRITLSLLRKLRPHKIYQWIFVRFCCCDCSFGVYIATNTTADCGTFQMAHDGKFTCIQFFFLFGLLITQTCRHCCNYFVSAIALAQLFYLGLPNFVQVILLTHRQGPFTHTVSNTFGCKQLHSLPFKPTAAQWQAIRFWVTCGFRRSVFRVANTSTLMSPDILTLVWNLYRTAYYIL